jgi:sarcosine oxidase subunit delta
MRIPCPWCGEREFEEFTYGGDATASRPADPEHADPETWTDYVYFRDNPRGVHDELWYHAHGCNQWFRVRRDTVTHDVIAAAPPNAGPSGEAK